MLKFQKEQLWESLCLMYQMQKTEAEGRALNALELRFVDALMQDMQDAQLDRYLRQLQEQLGGAELFLLGCDQPQSGVVIATTFKSELGQRWPLVGPVERALKSQPSVIFDAGLIPILKALPVVRMGQACSIVMRAWFDEGERLILLATHRRSGQFSSQEQNILDRGAWILKARGRALLSTLGRQVREGALGAPVDLRERSGSSSRSPSLSNSHLLGSSDSRQLEPSLQPKRILEELVEGGLLGDRYQIVGHLGSGGFGAVYKGYDPLIQRDVALKVLVHGEQLKDEKKRALLEEFSREAALAASIRHQNIVTIYDLGFHGAAQHPFMVMEFLDGPSLAAELKRVGPFKLRRLVELIIPVLDCLGEAHRNSLVHRDLKPSNLMLIQTQDHEALKLVDFGIARTLSSDQEKEKNLIGTLPYLAPEYITDQKISPRVDVYQMGLVMLELLTGTKPIQERGVTTFFRIVNGEITFPPHFQEHPLWSFIRRAVSLDPMQRYKDGDEMCQALRMLSAQIFASPIREGRSSDGA
ncbi:MAG: serine/threonine-protein kinase [Myxococcota bacterium]|nr:serine/threonine-protein kinase [Myxococcota bacterium]